LRLAADDGARQQVRTIRRCVCAAPLERRHRKCGRRRIKEGVSNVPIAHGPHNLTVWVFAERVNELECDPSVAEHENPSRVAYFSR